MSHYREVCEYGMTHGQCRCPSKDKEVREIRCSAPTQHAPLAADGDFPMDHSACPDPQRCASRLCPVYATLAARRLSAPTGDLTEDQCKTLLRHVLRSVLIQDGVPITIWDRLTAMGVQVDLLLTNALPLTTPPYSREEFDQMVAWLQPVEGNQQPVGYMQNDVEVLLTISLGERLLFMPDAIPSERLMMARMIADLMRQKPPYVAPPRTV